MDTYSNSTVEALLRSPKCYLLFKNTHFLLTSAAIVMSLGMLTLPMVRGIMSKMTPTDKQGNRIIYRGVYTEKKKRDITNIR